MAFTEQERQREDRVIGIVELSQRFAAERESLADNIETFSGGWDEEELEQVPSLHEHHDPEADFAEDQQMEGSEHSQASHSRVWETSTGYTNTRRSLQTPED